jgi:hypothetical protein
MPVPFGRRDSALQVVLPLISLVILLLSCFPQQSWASASLLEQRSLLWPNWQLPARLKSAGNQDLIYPEWFAGHWWVSSDNPDSADPRLQHEAIFYMNNGAAIGDRSFNANAVGKALMGAALLGVDNDPTNPNRQLARLRGEQLLESTVISRRQEIGDSFFWADELSLQVVHIPQTPPRISRVETLSHYWLLADGSIAGEQWQATYPSPTEGLGATPLRTGHWLLRLEPAAPGSDPAS